MSRHIPSRQLRSMQARNKLEVCNSTIWLATGPNLDSAEGRVTIRTGDNKIILGSFGTKGRGLTMDEVVGRLSLWQYDHLLSAYSDWLQPPLTF